MKKCRQNCGTSGIRRQKVWFTVWSHGWVIQSFLVIQYEILT